MSANDIPPPSSVYYGRKYAAEITLINAQIASGQSSYPGGAYLERIEDDSVFTLQGNAFVIQGYGNTQMVTASRPLRATDHAKILETTGSLTLTINFNALPPDFRCVVIPAGTCTIAGDGSTLINGSVTSITRVAANNAMFGIAARASAGNSYVVDGN